MAHYSDFDGVFFTIQDIVKELIYNRRRDLLSQIQFLIIENNPKDEHAKAVKNFARGLGNLVKVIDSDKVGTSPSRNKIIEEAMTNYVLVMDCHVMLCPTVSTLDRLITFITHNDKSEDLFSGPMVLNSFSDIYTHFNDEWGSGMWGRWGQAWNCICDSFHFSFTKGEDNKVVFRRLSDAKKITKCEYCDKEFPHGDYNGVSSRLKEEGYNRSGFEEKEKPFEIFAQGLGVFLTRKNSWLKFNSHASGFGGEECYIHEKYRMAGRKTVCLPFLKWIHRFGRPQGIQYPISTNQKLKNYMLEFEELGLDKTPLRKHFVEGLKVEAKTWDLISLETSNILSEKQSQPTGTQRDEELIETIKKLEKQIQDLSKRPCCKTKKQ